MKHPARLRSMGSSSVYIENFRCVGLSSLSSLAKDNTENPNNKFIFV